MSAIRLIVTDLDRTFLLQRDAMHPHDQAEFARAIEQSVFDEWEKE